MRVVMYPSWVENPYQKILSEKLMGLGAEVTLVNGKIEELIQSCTRNPDILHIHDFSFLFSKKSLFVTLFAVLSFFMFCIQLRIRGTKIVWTVHDIINHMRWHATIHRLVNIFFSRISNAIIIHFDSGKAMILEACQLKSDKKIFVIPHGVDADTYRDMPSKNVARDLLKIHTSAFVFLALGIIRPYKGLIELVGAFKMLMAQNVKLIIVGKVLDMDAEYLKELNRVSNQDVRVQIIPTYVPEDMVPIYMGAANACIFSYTKIFNSGSVLLAMSYGKACITPDIGCFKDYLGNSPLLYDPSKQNALFETLEYAFKNEATLEKIGIENMKHREKLTWQETAEQTLKLYNLA